MGLLRASADAVVIGASTVGAVDRAHVWIAGFVYPAAEAAYARYHREVLRKPRHPLIMIVSGSGRLDLERAVFHTSGISVLILTGERGHDHLVQRGAAALPSTQIRELPDVEEKIDPRAILTTLRSEFGVELLLHEGGPTLFGHPLRGGLVDELFLTMTPQIAGRSGEHPRPGLAANAQFVPGTAPWLILVSAKHQGNHLYLRYRTTEKAKDV